MPCIDSPQKARICFDLLWLLPGGLEKLFFHVDAFKHLMWVLWFHFSFFLLLFAVVSNDGAAVVFLDKGSQEQPFNFQFFNTNFPDFSSMFFFNLCLPLQHLIYLMCKTQALLIPSMGELQQLAILIGSYLKSSHIFIRNATLAGVLCLLECCSKTNTTMGRLSDEMTLLRDLSLGYINRHGLVDQR